MQKKIFRITFTFVALFLVGLVAACTKVNFSELQEVVDTHESRVEADYTSDSWGDYVVALDAAEAVLDNSKASQKEVDEAVTALKNAIDALVLKTATVDKAALNQVIAEANLKTEADYTSESWAPFSSALTAAQSVKDNASATQAQVDEAKNTLQSAISSLILKPEVANKAALQAAIASAEAKVEAEYTVESWDALATALAQAKTVNTNQTASQTEVDQAKDALVLAVNGLVLKVVDKTILQAQVDEALLKTEEEYLASDWTALQTALESAQSLLEDAEATQEEVAQALSVLIEAVNKAHGVTWVYPEETFVLTHDIIKFRADRENEIYQTLAGLLEATFEDASVQVIADSLSLPVRDENGLYPVGDWTITYKTLGKDDKLVTTSYTISIVEGKSVDTYFYGVTSEDYATAETVGGNVNWTGGEGIRVGKDFFFTLEGEITELPEHLLNSENGKLIDLDDPFAVQNKTENTISYKVNDTTGVHIVMGADGRVKMMYEGIQNDYWTVDGKSKLTPTNFGNQDINLEPGDIHLIIGYTLQGNYYSAPAANENHWRDGRFVARNTIGGAARVSASNVAKVVRGETLITLPYANQAPYLTKHGGEIIVPKDSAVPTKEQLLNGMEFKDDNGIWSKNDIIVDALNIEVTHLIDTATVGVYEVTMTVSDGTLSSVFKRTVSVIEAVSSDFISYTDASGVEQLYRNASAVSVYNQKSDALTGVISIYNATYFNENKADSNKFSGSNFGVYVLIGKNGEFVESYFNSNIINAANPQGAAVTGGNSNATLQALNTLTLEEGQYIMFFQQNAGEATVRTFAQALRDSFKNRIGEGKIKIIDVNGVNNLNYISYVNALGETVSYDWVQDVAVFNEKVPSAVGFISIYDAAYFNLNKTDSSKFSNSNYGIYVLVGKNGEFVESYFNSNIINAANPQGASVTGGNADATLQALNTLTLVDGQYIMFFQQNTGEAAVRTFAQTLRDSFKNRIGQPRITIKAFDQFNRSSISYQAGLVTKTLNFRNYLVNPATFNALNADITIYDKTFTGVAGFGYGFYVKVDSVGKVLEVYDGVSGKVYNDTNPNGATVPPANILKDYDFSTLAEGELIIVFPNNSHVKPGDDKPLTHSFAFELVSFVKGEAFNVNNISLELTFIFV